MSLPARVRSVLASLSPPSVHEQRFHAIHALSPFIASKRGPAPLAPRCLSLVQARFGLPTP